MTTLRANCKINLSLRITGVLPNGYHTLDSVFLPLAEPYDLLRITPGVAPGLTLRCSNPAIAPRDNTLTCAYKLYAEACAFAPPLALTLEKGIPSGAGLGGGSSDAAVLLRYLNAQAPQALDVQNLHALAARVGADVPFFLQDHPCRVRGTGDILEPYTPGLTGYWLVLVCPDLEISTAWAYAAWDALSAPLQHIDSPTQALPAEVHSAYAFMAGECQSTLAYDLTKQGSAASETDFRFHCLNDLEAAVFPTYPQLARIKNELFQQGAAGAGMSGSGASLFGLFRNQRAAQRAADFFQTRGRTYCQIVSC